VAKRSARSVERHGAAGTSSRKGVSTSRSESSPRAGRGTASVANSPSPARGRGVFLGLGVAVLVLAGLAVPWLGRLWRPSHGGAGVRPVAVGAAAGEEARLRDAAQREPRSAANRQALGRYYIDHGRPFEAIWELWAAHELQPQDPATSVQLAVALSAGQLDDQAIEQLESLATSQPPSREGRVQLAMLYLGRTLPQRALVVLKGAPDLANWAEGQLALGQTYEAMGQTALAIAAYQRVAHLAPTSVEPAYRLGSLYLHNHRFPAASTTLESSLRKLGPQARMLTLVAEVDTARGDTSAAERHLRAALKADPTHVPALDALGRLYHHQRRLNDSIIAYRRALQLIPGDAAAFEGLADLLEVTGRVAKAHSARAHAFSVRGLPIRALQEYEALAHSPGQEVTAVLEMGSLLLQTQQTLRAVRVTEAALTRRPWETALYERLVVLYLLLPDRARAQRRCEEWQRLEPASVRPVWLLGRIAAANKEPERAIRLLEQAQAAEPENPDFAVSLAEALLNDGRQPQLLRARQLVDQVVARSPTEAKIYQDQGQVLLRLGQPEAARQSFLRSLDLDPNVSDLYVNVAQIARLLGQPEQMGFWATIIRSVEARLRLELLRLRRTWEQPNDPEGHRDLALYFIQMVELRKAERQLEESLRLRPGWPEAEQLLATVRRTREVL
jgi:tetratricopeptide (TPR) repeat protein